MGWRIGRLADLCTEDREILPAGTGGGLPYVGLEDVESKSGAILRYLGPDDTDVPSGTAFRFSPHHILYGKLRPYLNKVALPDRDGRCSTELIPLRPKSDTSREFAAYALRRPDVVRAVMARNKGARMPRADIEFLLTLPIVIPPLAAQRRIVDILARVEGIIRLQRQAAGKAREIIPAFFLNMFGDPVTNPKGWPVTTIGDVIEKADYGTSKKASSNGSGIAIIRMGNVTYGGDLDLLDTKHVELSEEERQKYSLGDEDILFNRTNSKELVGKTGLWDGRFEAVAASYFIRVRANRSAVLPFYLWAFLNTAYMKHRLFAVARGAIGQSNINAKELRAFSIPIPTLRLQKEFSDRVIEIRSILAQRDMSQRSGDALFLALLAQTFSGQLGEAI